MFKKNNLTFFFGLDGVGLVKDTSAPWFCHSANILYMANEARPAHGRFLVGSFESASGSSMSTSSPNWKWKHCLIYVLAYNCQKKKKKKTGSKTYPVCAFVLLRFLHGLWDERLDCILSSDVLGLGLGHTLPGSQNDGFMLDGCHKYGRAGALLLLNLVGTSRLELVEEDKCALWR